MTMRGSLTLLPLKYLLFPTMVGWVAAIDGPTALWGILSGTERQSLEGEVVRNLPKGRQGESPRLIEAREQILEYLEGKRRDFRLELDFGFLSPFQKEVYGALMTVSYGTTITYGGLAARLGRSRAARAVGRAMAVNPFLLAVPCHRVVAADGSLHGFSGGGGIAVKEKLLALEQRFSESKT